MLIDGLIRMGLPLLNRGGSPAEVIRQITDVEAGAQFFQNVILVEIDVAQRRFAVHPPMAWGDWQEEPQEGGKGRRKKTQARFVPDRSRTVAAPFVLPKGGNPLKPQGATAYRCTLCMTNSSVSWPPMLRLCAIFSSGAWPAPSCGAGRWRWRR